MNKPYRQLLADENNEVFKYLCEKPLRLAVYLFCAMRTRRVKQPSPQGLKQGEFFFSQNEYKKFGLKKSQRGQLVRTLKELILTKIIAKTDTEIGSEHSAVYRLLSTELIDPNYETDTKTDSEQIANRYRTDTNNNVNNDKSVLRAGNDTHKTLSSFSKESEKADTPESLTDDFLLSMAKKYNVPLDAVKTSKERMVLLYQSKGKTFPNYQAQFNLWLHDDIFVRKTIKQNKSTVEQLREEYPGMDIE